MSLYCPYFVICTLLCHEIDNSFGQAADQKGMPIARELSD